MSAVQSVHEELHVLIQGRVQGVGFRAATRRTGERLGLSGWVRNLPSGEVEAYCIGPQAVVEEFLSFCKTGPALSRVTEVRTLKREVWRGEVTGEFLIR